MTEIDDFKPHKGHFSLPNLWDPREVAHPNDKVSVVSVFGKSDYDAGGCKAKVLELMLGRQIFRRDMIKPIDINQETLTGIEGYYDPERHVVFLHLTGVYDISALVKSLEKMHQQLQEKGFLVAWSELKLHYARSLLMLFCMSHILLLCFPSHVFDITYIHLFRTLDSVRYKTLGKISERLRPLPEMNDWWASNGRLCTPRVLFIFSSRLLPLEALKAATERSRTSGGQRTPRGATTPSPLRNLELALEDQIYRLLRKSRVITNNSSNSLFALPNNQAYVYILEEDQEDIVPSELISNTLQQFCNTSESQSIDLSLRRLSLGSGGDSGTKGKTVNSGSNMEGISVTALAQPIEADTLSSSILAPVATERTRNLEHSFMVFIQQHIDQVQSKGFDDDVGRPSLYRHFVTPTAEGWFWALRTMHILFISDGAEQDYPEGMEKDDNTFQKKLVSLLRPQIETEMRFSDYRCARALPLAISAYKEGLPPHYTKDQHVAKLDVALGVLAAQARGPMYDDYVGQLEEECERMWQDGRVGCQTLSLSGNTCHHPLHITSPDSKSGLPVINHSSGVVYISYCNCGCQQGQLEDPFTAHEANYNFYAEMSESCCGQLEQIAFPTFTPSVMDAKAAKLDSSSTYNLDRRSDSAPTSVRDTKDQLGAEISNTPILSFAGTGLSEHMSEAATSNRHTREDTPNTTSEVIIMLSKEEAKQTNKDKGVLRQVSTTEYLPGMLHTTSPQGLLPQWSAWSLVCLGPSSLYSHNAGICNQPGFLPDTNFLLPWDVTVKIEDKDKWPAIADSMGKKGFILKNKKNRIGDPNEFNVKIFLGTEYQCNRGHRFMMAAPDRHLKASPTGLVKDTAAKIANADMPLYFPCPCSRSGTVVNGQLMRIHVVTPKAPVNVTLNPQVQPAPEPCPRYIPQSSSAAQIKLSASAYWVLRLPYVFVGDQGPHYPPDPRQPSPTSFARLLKGCYGISQVTLGR